VTSTAPADTPDAPAGAPKGSSSDDRGFLHSTGVVSILTLASRVMGLLRDMATSHVLGDTAVNDALTMAWTVPNLFRRMFGEGALGSAFLSVFSRVLTTEGRERAVQVSNAVISAVAMFLLGMVAVLIAATYLVPESWSLWVLGPEHADKVQLTLQYTRLLLPYLAAICVIAQFMAVLNAAGEFGVPAFSPIILNVVWLMGIGAAAWWGATAGDDTDGSLAHQGTIIAASILVASVVQIAWHLPALKSRGLAFRPQWPKRTPEVSEVALLMGPMLLGMGSAQLNILADRTIAMRSLGDGGVSHLYYGLRLMQFPLGLVSVALVTTVFPALTKLVAQGNRRGAADTACFALRTNMLIAVPAAVGLAVLAQPIIQLLFQSGRFTASSTEATSQALIGYSLGIPFAGTVMLLTRACYAVGDVRFPVRVGIITTGVNVALDLVLVGPFGEFGLAAATSLTALVTTVLLAMGVRHRLGLESGERLMTSLLPTIALGALLAVAVAGADLGVAGRLAEGRLDALIRVAVGLVTGLGSFVLLAPRLCPREWGEVVGLIRRKRGSG
jgi:putative peptidoglycan lipid II flippase